MKVPIKPMYFALLIAAATTTCSEEETIDLKKKVNDSTDSSDFRELELGKLSEEPQEHNKLRGFQAETLGTFPADKEIAAIIKVSKDGYLPSEIVPIARVSPYLFTTRLRLADIRRLESDPDVASIELTQRLQSMEDN